MAYNTPLRGKNTQAGIRSEATGSLRVFVPVSASERLQRLVMFTCLLSARQLKTAEPGANQPIFDRILDRLILRILNFFVRCTAQF